MLNLVPLTLILSDLSGPNILWPLLASAQRHTARTARGCKLPGCYVAEKWPKESEEEPPTLKLLGLPCQFSLQAPKSWTKQTCADWNTSDFLKFTSLLSSGLSNLWLFMEHQSRKHGSKQLCPSQKLIGQFRKVNDLPITITPWSPNHRPPMPGIKLYGQSMNRHGPQCWSGLTSQKSFQCRISESNADCGVKMLANASNPKTSSCLEISNPRFRDHNEDASQQ